MHSTISIYQKLGKLTEMVKAIEKQQLDLIIDLHQEETFLRRAFSY